MDLLRVHCKRLLLILIGFYVLSYFLPVFKGELAPGSATTLPGLGAAILALVGPIILIVEGAPIGGSAALFALGFALSIVNLSVPIYAFVIFKKIRWRVTTMGIYVVLAIALLAPAYVIYVWDLQSNGNILIGFWIWWIAVLGVLSLGVIFVTAPLVQDGLCRQCGYDLHGSAESMPCPECGTPFEVVNKPNVAGP